MDEPKRAPSFQFYPADWLSSPHVMMMKPSEEGAYIRLLCYAWADPDCGIPDDDATLARLSRLGRWWYGSARERIRECFKSDMAIPGKLVNERLRKEREKQSMWREKSSCGGITSQKNRRQVEGWLPNGSTKPQPLSKMVQPERPSSVEGWFNSSSSSSSSSKEKENKEKESPASASLGAPSQGPLGVGSEAAKGEKPNTPENPQALTVHSLTVDKSPVSCQYHVGSEHSCRLPVTRNHRSRPRCGWHTHVETVLGGIGTEEEFGMWHLADRYLSRIPVEECWAMANHADEPSETPKRQLVSSLDE